MKPGFGRHFQRANMTAPVSILQELGMLFREQLRSQFKKKFVVAANKHGLCRCKCMLGRMCTGRCTCRGRGRCVCGTCAMGCYEPRPVWTTSVKPVLSVPFLET